jgi:hypothetical protein
MHFLAFAKKSQYFTENCTQYTNINFEIFVVCGVFVSITFQKIKPFLLGILDQAHLYSELN